MKKKLLKYYLILFLPLIIAGCSQDIAEPVNLGYDYFPLSIGDFRVYNVVRIDHNIDLTSDTTEYQLKEVIGDNLWVGDEQSYRVERYTRKNEDEAWTTDSVWTARRNSYQAIVVENNVPVIKLSFPVKEDRRWDGNAMNAREYDQFKMINLGNGITLEQPLLSFDNTLTLVKEDALDPSMTVTDDYRIEVFTSGIGMIYRNDIYRKYCGNCGAPGIIEFGTEIEYSIIDYSIND